MQIVAKMKMRQYVTKHSPVDDDEVVERKNPKRRNGSIGMVAGGGAVPLVVVGPACQDNIHQSPPPASSLLSTARMPQTSPGLD